MILYKNELIAVDLKVNVSLQNKTVDYFLALRIQSTCLYAYNKIILTGYQIVL